MAGRLLQQRPDPVAQRHIEEIHAFIFQALQTLEVDGGRNQQVPILIHSVSGLEWKYALMVYDACRAFEPTRSGGLCVGSRPTPEQLAQARSVSFSAPTLRHHREWALGSELHGLLWGR